MRKTRWSCVSRSAWWWLLVLTGSVHAGWEDRTLGEPLLQSFNRASVGFSIDAWSLAHDPHTRAIWVGSTSELLRFDGAEWEHIPLARGLYVRSMHVESRDLVWYGTSDDVGYARQVNGQWETASLQEHWPAGEPPPKDVFATFKTGHYVDFCMDHRLARWDGERFRIWKYTTAATRIYPLQFDGSLWFHHRESGLYRVTLSGPHLVAGPEALPRHGLMGLFSDGRGLVGISNHGMLRIAPGMEAVHEPQTAEFLAANIVSAVTALPRGYQAVGTMRGGIAVISPAGKIVRRIDTASGLPGDVAYALLLDAEGYVWHAARGAVTRFLAWPAATALRIGSTRQVRVNRLDLAHGRLWVATDGGVFHLDESAQPVAVNTSGKSDALAAFHTGVLIGRFAGVDFLEHGKLKPVADLPGRDVFGLLPSRRSPDTVFIAESFQVTRATFLEGKLQPQTATRLPASALSMVEDDSGRLWLGLHLQGVRRLDPQRGTLEDVTPAAARSLVDNHGSVVVAIGPRIHLLVADRLFLADGDHSLLESAVRLPGKVVAAAAARDGRRLYAVISRPDVPRLAEGLVAIELDGLGRAVRVRDLQVPELAFAGAVSSMQVDADGEHEILWIAGNDGLLRVRPDELAEWKPTRPPLLHVRAATTEEGAQTAFHFGGHHLTLAVKATENLLQPTFRFQTRLARGEDAPWSAPSARAVFEVSNLMEGTYTFAARAVNVAGQASEATHYTFRVLPPWYRSTWAYSGYAFVTLLGIVGVVLYRERRSRRRTRLLERLVRERTAQLEKASAAKDEFLASMSHEIRNPMNGVVGLSAAIDITALDPEARRRFEMLRHCAVHLSTLLEDILDFSRLESGHIEIAMQPFSLSELLAAVTSITTPDSVAAGVSVEAALAPNLPPNLVGDARRIRQILINFVSNGLKYGGRGKIEVTVWGRALDERRHEITFAVSDEGPGIAPEDQERIFQKFERGAAARDTRVPGTGMGLAVCRMLAEKMGGRVWVESTPGRGSTFCLRLTFATGAGATAAAAPALPPVLKWALVVDDEEYNCIALAATLEQLGFRVRQECDPLQALALAEHQPFDVVFLDYDMPRLTGPELARRLRALRPNSGEPAILIATTAYSTEEKRAECLAAGMDGFMGKPVAPDRIAAVLQQVLRTRAPAGMHYPPDQFSPLDRWENLQRVAERRGTDLATQAALFLEECERELQELLRRIDEENQREAAAGAHRLAGRFAFVHSRTASHLATKLEQCAQRYEWSQARELHGELLRHWEAVRRDLKNHPSAPAA